MKKHLLIRLMVVSLVIVCGMVFFQARANKQIAENQCIDQDCIPTKKHISGEFIIWESITRYITVGYH